MSVRGDRAAVSIPRPRRADPGDPRQPRIFDTDNAAGKVKTEVRKLAGRWLGDVERRLEDREWIACADFTAADIMMAGVLRTIRKSDLMEPFPRIKAYHERRKARPAWQRTLDLSAKRLGMSVDDIR
jgi:glutathione S-transferase